ncbi:MAG: ABC transporter permease [Anaerolineae bacterium]|jgi:putative ABC transport system permease protein|nr:ABC transporter permease [Anaerolineae bacterium]
MNFLHILQEAFESLWANKSRSLLTILGIVIGVGAVIALMSLGNGVQEEITGQITSAGSNLIFVFQEGASEEIRNPKPLTLDDVDALETRDFDTGIQYVAPVLSGGGQAVYDGQETNVSVTGSTPSLQPLREYNVEYGTWFTDLDQFNRESVAVIGSIVADDLFNTREEAIGSTIRINGHAFQVIGVMEEMGYTAGGTDDDDVFVPITTAQSRLFARPTKNQVDLIYVKTFTADGIELAQDYITFILRDQHGLSGEDPNDFQTFTQQSILDIATQITGLMTTFLGAIAAVSLVVGGIGIMNIMLVSVTERTREIGLRKALGARQITILTQFLSESVVLSLVGGIIGIILGYILSVVLGDLVDVTAVIQGSAVFLATMVSAVVGIVFGVYPASRAAKLPPVEALRYE